MGGCFTVICDYETLYDNTRVCRTAVSLCIEDDFNEYTPYLLVENGYEEYFEPLVNMFKKYYPTILILVNTIIKDLEYLHGTHSAKDRCIARIKKFIRILGELGITYPFITSFYSLLKPILIDIEKILLAMSRVKNEYHRVRNPIHELLYPRLRRNLEAIANVSIKYVVVDKYKAKLEYIVDFAIDDKPSLKIMVNKHYDYQGKRWISGSTWSNLDEVLTITSIMISSTTSSSPFSQPSSSINFLGNTI